MEELGGEAEVSGFVNLEKARSYLSGDMSLMVVGI